VPAAPPVAAAVSAAPFTPPSDVEVTMPPQPPADGKTPSHAPAYVAFAAGTAGVGMIVAFGILSLQENSTLSHACTGGNCPPGDAATLSSLKLYENMADVGIGVAAAGLVTGILLFVTDKPSSSSSASRRVEPFLGLGSAGVRGSF